MTKTTQYTIEPWQAGKSGSFVGWTIDTVPPDLDKRSQHIARVTTKKSADLIVATCNSYRKHCGARAVEAAEADLLGEALTVCKVLAIIADRYDNNSLDDEARKFWGKANEHKNVRDPQDIELFCGRGGGRLLTLADCFAARAVLAKAKPT